MTGTEHSTTCGSNEEKKLCLRKMSQNIFHFGPFQTKCLAMSVIQCASFGKFYRLFFQLYFTVSVPSNRLYTMGFRPDSLSAVAIGVGYVFG